MCGTLAKLSSVAAATIEPSIATAAAACRSLPLIPRTFIECEASLPPGRVRDEEVADRQVIQVSLQKRPNGIVGRADDRLLVHVEARVDERRDPGELVILRENAVKARIRRRRDELRPRRTVDVYRGR